MEVNFSLVTGDTFNVMLDILENESWDLELHAQSGTELSVRPVSISFHGKYEVLVKITDAKGYTYHLGSAGRGHI